MVSFQCDQGFTLQGNAYITCMPGPVRSSVWRLYDRLQRRHLSPGFPGNYQSSLDCSWRVQLPIGFGIHLQFMNFSTEPVHDYLEVRSGNLETGTVIDRSSGPVLPNSLFSTTHETTLFFHSDYSQNKHGFHIVYQAYELQRCPDPRPFRNGIVIGQEYSVGMTISFECLSGYTLLGEPSLTCLHGVSRNWNHPIPRCEVQQLHLSESQLLPLPFSSLSVARDGPDQASPQIGQFSGNSVQEGVSTTANQVLIKFHSDFSTSGFFVLKYYAYQLRACQPPPPVANATILTDDDEFEIGDIIQYSCLPGFTLVGSEILTCRLGERLQMDAPPPVCQETMNNHIGIVIKP
ncbi:hypothetical protein F7725_018768 [Dissostichus mawsoni]|uniref:Uncharacterized protein n=1 Tax=Dissostichus mawsoni TaxID=36200 RepID=A0A7J5XT44_DISMA|nr:hypothetical protein F7725_018768 [Dissostichus mawsoni]